MKTMLLAAGAAAVALSAGAAIGAVKGPTVAGPKQPIPYSQLSAYLKASPKVRASKDWWSGQQAGAAPMPTAGADTGAAANTSAKAPVTPSLPGDTSVNPPSGAAPAPPTPAAPPIDNPPSATPPNAATPAAPGTPETATPPK